MTDVWGISCKIALRWMPLDLTDDKSTLVQVMAWCLTAPSHYLNQCWPRSLPPYVITRPQGVNSSYSKYRIFWKKCFNPNLCWCPGSLCYLAIRTQYRTYQGIFIPFALCCITQICFDLHLIRPTINLTHIQFYPHAIGFDDYTDLLWWK